MTVSRDEGGANGGPKNEADSRERPQDHRALGLRDGLAGLRDLMDRLLAADGCPWDRAQTLRTLRPYLLEEAYEVHEAMEATGDDAQAHCQELGDLLFQIVFQAALREREGAFDLDAVVSAIVTKLIRRHPHVFESRTGDAQTPQEVARLWEATKRAERGEAWQTQPLGDLPPDLPALLRAPRLQQRAAALGFDWPDIDGAIAKFHEEWDELEHARKAGSRAAMEEEFGDLLFVLVRVGQKLGIVADTALALANRKFETRFAHVVRRCMAEGLDPAGAGLDRLEAFWQDAKRLEKSAQSPESPERPE